MFDTDEQSPDKTQENTAVQNDRPKIDVGPTANIDKTYSYQPKDDNSFEWNGQKFDIKTLPPEAIKEFYKNHSNITNWRKKLTQGQQELANQRKYIENIKGQLDTVNSFFDEHPDLIDIVKAYKEAVDNGEDTKAYLLKKVFNNTVQNDNKMSNSDKAIVNNSIRLPFETQSEYETRLKNLEDKLAQREQEEIENKAKQVLKQKFPDLSDEEFQNYADKFSGENVGLPELFELIEKARRYDKMLQEKSSSEATLLGTGYNPQTINSQAPNATTQQSDNPDDIFKSIWEKAFKRK